MDAQRFDALTRALANGSRRGLLGTLVALPVLGGLLTVLEVEDTRAKGRRKRRKKRHKHGQGPPKNRKGKRNRKCRRKSRAKICANRCGIVKNRQTRKCKKKINCGPCACNPPCTVLGEECVDGVCVQTCPDLPPNADLQAAIEATPAGGTLTLCPGAWHLTATVTITQNLTLRGVGAEQTVLDGQDAVRVLQIGSGVEVTLEHLAVTGGASAGTGGGIRNDGTLVLRGVAVTDNTAVLSGGGIFSIGAVTLEDGSRVAGNFAATFHGGGIYNDFGTLILKAGSLVGGDTLADANVGAQFGGGIFNAPAATAELQDGSRVAGNTAATGGGIYNNANGTVTVQEGALVCDNEPFNDQCAGPAPIGGVCPNPASGTCPD